VVSSCMGSFTSLVLSIMKGQVSNWNDA
jgi:hypothetical protein